VEIQELAFTVDFASRDMSCHVLGGGGGRTVASSSLKDKDYVCLGSDYGDEQVIEDDDNMG